MRRSTTRTLYILGLVLVLAAFLALGTRIAPGRASSVVGANASTSKPATAAASQKGQQAARVEIDIMPTERFKNIDLGSRDDVPVAILSGKGFDASTVDPASINFAGTSALKEIDNGSTSPDETSDLGEPGTSIRHLIADVNSDGSRDMVAYFSIPYLSLVAGRNLAVLSAHTNTGATIEGSQQVMAFGKSSLGRSEPVGGGFCNAATITIPSSGAATPYPSNISVSGLTGVVTNVTVDVFGLSHTFPDDIDILLVSPSGKAVPLMSDVGSSTDITNVNLTFDDAAAQFFTDSGTIVSGTFRPTNMASDSFPAGAPVPTAANPFGGTLAFFNGSNPNGTWSLFVADDVGGDTGQISGGWCLNITTAASSQTCQTALVSSSFAPGDPTLPSGRPFRNGVSSNCVTPKVCSLTPPSAGTFRFKTFNFTNQSGSTACVTATVTADQATCPAGIFASAFLGSVDTANFCTNYLGDAGSSPVAALPVPAAYSFSVAAGGTFVVLVNETVSANATGCASFSILAEGNICAPPGGCIGITCPGGITVSNTPSLCGATVNYSAPTPNGNCGIITCSPVSGSFFPVGTTAVNCSSNLCDNVFATTTTNQLVRFNSATPGTIISNTAITGLLVGDQIVGIDFRPATAQLYALGVNGATTHLYTLNAATAAATQVGGNIALPQSAGVSAGTEFGFDFNPVVDRIRVVANSRDNFRLNPVTGAVAGADTALTAGSNIAGAGYDRNFAGATQTTLFGIDSVADALVTIGGINGVPSPNTGVVTAVGSLGANTSDLVGFDVTSCATAFAALNVGGVSGLYSVNLVTGAATLVGNIGSGLQIRSLAVSTTTASCAFNVIVQDTQPPSITCPADQTAVTDQSVCQTGACQVVSFPAPMATDNCPGAGVVCSPPSGSCFPTGITTVTCTATDASSNAATCSFMVTSFDSALQDDSNAATILLWNSITGQYRICCNGITLTGVGKATRQGCVYTLDHTNAVDRRVLGRVDKAVHAGSGSLQAPAGATRCTITDRNTLNDTLLPACQ